MCNVNIQGVARIIREYYALLYCCNGYFSAERKLRLYDNTTHKDRVLEIGQCPKCGAIKVLVSQKRIGDNKYSERKPKNSKTIAKFIRKYEKEAYYEIPNLKPKYGTKLYTKDYQTLPLCAKCYDDVNTRGESYLKEDIKAVLNGLSLEDFTLLAYRNYRDSFSCRTPC